MSDSNEAVATSTTKAKSSKSNSFARVSEKDLAAIRRAVKASSHVRVAGQIGVSDNTLYLIEKGETGVRPSTLELIAKFADRERRGSLGSAKPARMHLVANSGGEPPASKRKFSRVPKTHVAALRGAVGKNGATEVAQELGLSTGALYDVLKGKSGVRPSTLAKIGSFVEGARKAKDDLGPEDVLGAARAVTEALSGLPAAKRRSVLELVLALTPEH